MTVWHLDTCKCKLEVSDDDATRGQIVGIVKACTVHSAHTHHEIAEENRNKNRVTSLVKSTFPGQTFRWEIGQNRRIEVTLNSKLTAKEKSDINAKLTDLNGIVL